jgi:hypothetical protein
LVQPPAPKPSLIKLSSLEPAAAARLTAVRNLIEAQGRHDLPAVLACFGPEPTLEFAGGPRHIGAERVGQIYGDLLRAFPDLVIDVMAEHVGTAACPSRWRCRASPAMSAWRCAVAPWPAGLQCLPFDKRHQIRPASI